MHLHVAPSIVLPAGSALKPDSPCRAFQLYHGWPVVLVADHRAGAWTDKDASTGKTGLPGVGTDRDGPPRSDISLIPHAALSLLCIENSVVEYILHF